MNALGNSGRGRWERMGRIFNINGDCQKELHYMVDMSERIKKIKEMVDAGQYLRLTEPDSLEKQRHCWH